jgi:pimeloyl-ACP methyl ester carboxylesterase
LGVVGKSVGTAVGEVAAYTAAEVVEAVVGVDRVDTVGMAVGTATS